MTCCTSTISTAGGSMNELIDFSYLKFDKDSNSGSDEKYNDLFNNEWYMFKFGTLLPPNENFGRLSALTV